MSRHWPTMMKAREDELIRDIARNLDPSQRDAVRPLCESMRGEFRNILEAGVSVKKLLAIRNVCLRAAKAVGDDALPDWDWLPWGEFSVRYKKSWNRVRRGPHARLCEKPAVKSLLGHSGRSCNACPGDAAAESPHTTS
jgi:hypothetical protein